MLTEDDTYNKLRRIPISQLEEKMGLGGNFIRRVIETGIEEDIINLKEYKTKMFMNRWLPFLGKYPDIYIHTAVDVQMMLAHSVDARIFPGTGWTAAEYIEEVKKETLVYITKLNEKRRISKRNNAIGAFMSGLITGTIMIVLPTSLIPVWGALALAVPIGIVSGVLIRKWWLPT